MSNQIQLKEAVDELIKDTDDKELKNKLRDKIHNDYSYAAKKNSWVRTNKITDLYYVDANEFYSWIKNKFQRLKHNIPEEYRWTKYTGFLDACYSLDAFSPTPECTTLEEAKIIIQEQADKLRDMETKLMELEHKLTEVLPKAKKYDEWIRKTRRKNR